MSYLTEIDTKTVRNIKKAVKAHSQQLEDECGIHVRVGKQKHLGKKGNSYTVQLSFYPYSTCEQCGTRMVADSRGMGKHYCTPKCKAKAYRMRREQRNEAVRQENKVLREENQTLREALNDPQS